RAGGRRGHARCGDGRHDHGRPARHLAACRTGPAVTVRRAGACAGSWRRTIGKGVGGDYYSARAGTSRAAPFMPPAHGVGDNRAMDRPHTDAPAPTPELLPPDPQLLADWQQLLARPEGGVAELLAQIAAGEGPALADHFYTGMLGDPRASRFLDPGQVRDRLKPSLQRWLRELVGADASDATAVHRLQEHVGHVHARIGIPVDLVGRGARMLKTRMHAEIRQRASSHAQALDASIRLDSL